MTPRPPDDAELQALYREAAQETPDQAIDARLLAAAQQLAAERQGRRERPAPAWWKRWLVPVSVTAVAVLGVSLSLQVNEEQAVLQAQRQQPATPQAAEAPAAQKPERQDAAGAPPYPPALADRSTERATSRSTAPTAAPPAEAAASRATPQLHKKTEDAPALPKEAHREESSQPAVQSTLPPAAAVTPAAPAAVERRARNAEREAAPNALGGTAAKSARGLADQERDTVRHEETPEQWLERIRHLRRDGQLTRAGEELRRFRERYPAFVLPPDLR